jgi:hypothetical protein
MLGNVFRPEILEPDHALFLAGSFIAFRKTADDSRLEKYWNANKMFGF